MRRIRLSNKEVRELRAANKAMAPILEKADVVEVAQLSEKESIYLIDGEPLFVKVAIPDLGDVIAPTLFLIHKSSKASLLPAYPKAVVDAGAVKRIIDGADVMRPGIKHLDGDFEKGDVVFVTDEKGRVIAMSVALFSRAEIEQMQKGKVLINIHYLGDKIWRVSQELAKKTSSE
ncbi:MAG: RNA-binding protein [Pyrobaculum sp.]|uniref:Universal archaeal PUA-domain protein n=1 Tax=Pyrobaculum oguniense (strain DSM 13380 / JCM 10595 / TE7) TaxID=698757 RepID=H6Q657_PYROT|nr:universal archaeal PUA-domain protein [Pyrobaculum oguniense TE7]